MLVPQSSLQTLFIQKPKEAEKFIQLANLLSQKDQEIKLVTSKGEEAIIPDTVYQILLTCVRSLGRGEALTIVPHNRHLSTKQAADILGVSEHLLIKLLEQGEIPYIQVGSHPTITFEDLMIYAQKRDQQRENILNELIQMTEAAGLYEFDEKLG